MASMCTYASTFGAWLFSWKGCLDSSVQIVLWGAFHFSWGKTPTASCPTRYWFCSQLCHLLAIEIRFSLLTGSCTSVLQ